jgi:transposase
LQSHKHVTLQLVWEEYRQAHPDSHDYSRFCDLYRSWLQKRNLVLRHQHRAGEKLFVDHAGDTIPLTNPETGEITAAYLFVAVLGASSYTYAEATQFRDLPNWIGSHLRAFEHFSGVPEIVAPDNWKTGVTRACRYEPDLNPQSHLLGDGSALPCRHNPSPCGKTKRTKQKLKMEFYWPSVGSSPRSVTRLSSICSL